MKYPTVQEALDLAQLACGEQEVAVRDLGLLSSALHRPQSQMFGVEAYTDLFEKVAALLQSLATNAHWLTATSARRGCAPSSSWT